MRRYGDAVWQPSGLNNTWCQVFKTGKPGRLTLPGGLPLLLQLLHSPAPMPGAGIASTCRSPCMAGVHMCTHTAAASKPKQRLHAGQHKPYNKSAACSCKLCKDWHGRKFSAKQHISYMHTPPPPPPHDGTDMPPHNAACCKQSLPQLVLATVLPQNTGNHCNMVNIDVPASIQTII